MWNLKIFRDCLAYCFHFIDEDIQAQLVVLCVKSQLISNEAKIRTQISVSLSQCLFPPPSVVIELLILLNNFLWLRSLSALEVIIIDNVFFGPGSRIEVIDIGDWAESLPTQSSALKLPVLNRLLIVTCFFLLINCLVKYANESDQALWVLQ